MLGVDSHYYLFAEGDAAEEGGEVYTLTQSDADRFKSADPSYGVRLTENNTLELATCYSVTAADGIENGTVTASPAIAIPGTSVALTVTPDEDYAVDTVTVNGTEIEPDDGAYGFEMPEEDVTVSAAFVLSVSPDQAAANKVIRKIDAIGEVVYNSVCAGMIHAARQSYDELTDVQKALVTNYDILTKAEKDYADLEETACTITIIMDLQNKGENVTVKVAPGISVIPILNKAFPDDLPTCYGFEVAGLSLHPMADDPTEEEIDAAENEILLFNATEDTTIYLVWRSTGELEGDLDDHVAAFEQAKVNAAGTLAELSQDGDSAACGRIIAAALEAMETLAYDYTVSPDENMAAVAAIVTQAETDLAAQRAQPQPLRLALLPVVGLHLLQHGFIAGKEDVAGHVGGRRQYFVHAVAHPHGLELHLHGQLVVHGGQPRVELRESDQVRHPAFGVFRRGLAAPPARVFRPGDGRVFELQRVAKGDIEPLDLLHGHILQLFGVPFKGHIPHVGVVGDDDLSVISRGTQNTRL